MHYYRFLGAFASTLTFLIAPNFISYRGVRVNEPLREGRSLNEVVLNSMVGQILNSRSLDFINYPLDCMKKLL